MTFIQCSENALTTPGLWRRQDNVCPGRCTAKYRHRQKRDELLAEKLHVASLLDDPNHVSSTMGCFGLFGSIPQCDTELREITVRNAQIS